jgi:hypothetical protein
MSPQSCFSSPTSTSLLTTRALQRADSTDLTADSVARRCTSIDGRIGSARTGNRVSAIA